MCPATSSQHMLEAGNPLLKNKKKAKNALQVELQILVKNLAFWLATMPKIPLAILKELKDPCVISAFRKTETAWRSELIFSTNFMLCTR